MSISEGGFGSRLRCTVKTALQSPARHADKACFAFLSAAEGLMEGHTVLQLWMLLVSANHVEERIKGHVVN